MLSDDLLEVVRGEHAKVQQWVQAQQMELHQAQMQYAQYSAMAVCIHSFLFLPLPAIASSILVVGTSHLE